MAFSEELAERIRQGLARRKRIEERKMFGGIGFLLNGNLLVGVWKDSLIARLGPDDGDEALKEPHVSEFDITGRAMKGWVLVDEEGIQGDDDLSGWVQQAVKFVGKLAVKYAEMSPVFVTLAGMEQPGASNTHLLDLAGCTRRG